MKYFVFMVLLPCILAAELQNAVCLDGTQCSQGKYCCASGCCDISKEMQDKGYVPAIPPASPLNITVSMAEPKTMNSFCFGTQCGEYCLENVHGGTCCPNPRYGCPSIAQCCGNSYSEVPWCCKKSQACSQERNYCINNPDSCDGTLCEGYCFEKDYGRTCCPNPQYSCPPNARCCGNSNSGDPWCCKKSQACSPIRDMCINSEDTCDGTQCGSYCKSGIYHGTCCNNPEFVCPDKSKCCKDSISDRYFCCKKNQQCGFTMNMCINSAVTTSIAMMLMLFASMLGIASKYFL